PETAPFTETTLALPLKQKYVFGAPEVDIREMEELLKVEKEGHEERMAQWRQAMKEWNERKQAHERDQNNKVTKALTNPLPYKEKGQCGCQQALVSGHCCCAPEERGHCGCDQALRCGHCCCKKQCKPEVTCEYARQK